MMMMMMFPVYLIFMACACLDNGERVNLVVDYGYQIVV